MGAQTTGARRVNVLHNKLGVTGSSPVPPTELGSARTWSSGPPANMRSPRTLWRGERIPEPASNLRAGRVRAAGRCGCGGRGGRRLDDLRSSGGDRVPPGAEGEAALASCLTRPLVERVGVKRVP